MGDFDCCTNGEHDTEPTGYTVTDFDGMGPEDVG